MAELEILVWVRGDSLASSNLFVATALDSTLVANRKELVYAKVQYGLKGHGAADLTLWKLKYPVPLAKVDEAVAALSQNLSEVAVKMLPMDDLSNYFSENPPHKNLHVIVQLQSSGSTKRPREEFEQNQPGLFLKKPMVKVDVSQELVKACRCLTLANAPNSS